MYQACWAGLCTELSVCLELYDSGPWYTISDLNNAFIFPGSAAAYKPLLPFTLYRTNETPSRSRATPTYARMARWEHWLPMRQSNRHQQPWTLACWGPSGRHWSGCPQCPVLFHHRSSGWSVNVRLQYALLWWFSGWCLHPSCCWRLQPCTQLPVCQQPNILMELQGQGYPG